MTLNHTDSLASSTCGVLGLQVCATMPSLCEAGIVKLGSKVSAELHSQSKALLWVRHGRWRVPVISDWTQTEERSRWKDHQCQRSFSCIVNSRSGWATHDCLKSSQIVKWINKEIGNCCLYLLWLRSFCMEPWNAKLDSSPVFVLFVCFYKHTFWRCRGVLNRIAISIAFLKPAFHTKYPDKCWI